MSSERNIWLLIRLGLWRVWRGRRSWRVRERRLSLGIASWIEFYRARTLESKEPETLDWIDHHIAPGDVMYDVGANIGQFALYAALGGARVLAFEPESQNFARLNENIVANGAGELLTAYPIGISDQLGFDRLFLQSLEKGAALHNIGEAVDQHGKVFRAAHAQGTVAVPIDDLHERFGLPFPNHLKIDVDGIERRVIAGAQRTLRDARLRSVLIEIGDTDANRSIATTIEEAGLRRVAEYPPNVIFAREA